MYFSPHSLFFSRLKNLKHSYFQLGSRLLKILTFVFLLFPVLPSIGLVWKIFFLEMQSPNLNTVLQLRLYSLNMRLYSLNMRISSYGLDVTVLFTHLSVLQLFSQRCDSVDACSVCDLLWSPAPFLKTWCLFICSQSCNCAVVIFLLKCWSWHLYLFNCILFLQPVCQEHFEFFSCPATCFQLCQFGIVGKSNQCKLHSVIHIIRLGTKLRTHPPPRNHICYILLFFTMKHCWCNFAPLQSHFIMICLFLLN